MSKATLVVRILLGIALLIFGANKFLHFLPMPAPPADMGAYLGALNNAGFIFPISGVIYLIAGIMFLTDKFTALGAILLFPIMLNAFLAHLFLDVPGIGPAALLLAFNIYLFYAYKDRYADILRA